MKIPSLSLCLLGVTMISNAPAASSLVNGLAAYYDFEETGLPGLANKAPGATLYNGTWSAASFATGAGPGFAGNAAFNPGDGLSNRSPLLAGNSLNVIDSSDQFMRAPLGTAEIGKSLTLSVWTFLAPGAANTSARFHAMETGDTGVFDLSVGTTSTYSTTGRDDYAIYAGSNALLTNVSGVTEGQWQHHVIVASSDGTNVTATYYLNGVPTGTPTTTAVANFSFTLLHFGDARSGRAVSDDRHWDGMLDEVAIWNRALTPAEVTSVRSLGLQGLPLTTERYALTLTASPATGGSVTGSGLYDINATVPVAATPSAGYVFAGWSGPFTGQPASFTHTVTADVTASATFAMDMSDADNDGLSAHDEIVIHGTNPALRDTDNDNIPDGDEVNLTRTSPLVNDSALVAYVAANLCSGSAGVVALGSAAIALAPGSGDIVLDLPVYGSPDTQSWALIPLDGPVVDVVPAGVFIDLTLPAPSSAVNSYSVQARP